MIWLQLVYFLATTLLSAALGPKPPKPKSAALSDFDVPVAEEGRPIPVIFGEVEITGANVLWYGDFDVKSIKKSGLFGSSTVGYRYFLGLHMAYCHGPVDALTEIKIGEKVAWTGSITSNSTGTINQPSLFGGKKREGGVVGDFDLLMGGAAQTANAYLSAQIGGTIPAFRGVTSLAWKGGEIGNTPYLKPWAVKMRRILQGWQNDAVWNSTKATIDTNKMNPAHILYECITNKEWGLGEPSASIDTISWSTVADQLFNEEFGLALMWNQQTSVEDFMGIILDHIGGMIGLRHDTGQYVLKLVRGDYDPEDLDEYNEGDIEKVTSFQRQGWGETTNELTLTYTDPETRKPTSVTVQDLANIRIQGGTVSHSITYSGILDHDLAQKVAARELLAVSTPLAKMDFETNRRFWPKSQGDVIRISYDEHGLESVVFRVLKSRGGTLKDGKITVSVIEDIFGLPGSIYTQQPTVVPSDVEPATPDDRETGPNVLAIDLTAPPGSPVDGDRYYIPNSPAATGAWAGHEGEFAEWDSEDGVWEFTEPSQGGVIFNEDTGEHFSLDDDGDVVAPPWPAEGVGINSQSGTSYTLVLTDAEKCVEMNNSSANTLTVPPNSSVAFPINTTILVRQMGTGATTVVAGSGVTIRTPRTLGMASQYSLASLHKRATDEWCIEGGVV